MRGSMSNKTSMQQALLQEIFEYSGGELLWRYDRAPRARKGAKAGSVMNHGYKGVKISGKTYLLSRLIYVYHYGEIPEGLFVDHIDRDPTNNKIENLRLLTHAENTWNTEKSKGFHVLPSGNFRTEITAKGVKYSLGVFNTRAEAMLAYGNAKIKLHRIERTV